MTAKYRDLSFVLTFGVNLISYTAPVAYDMFKQNIIAPGGKYYYLYMLNPITPIINNFRYSFLGIGSIDWCYYFISWITSLMVLFIGLKLFSRVERTFMDIL
jgi:lipopolysaccharide transport system permease protein